MRHYEKSLAGMVICGSGPNLFVELSRSKQIAGFPDPDLFDHFAHSGRRLLTPPSSDVRLILLHHHATAAACAGTR
ncbi:hypothetical protein [Sphingomonas antarctica]|uniref:hypothetical protein n=1 Tax=Sphingomonas antarctica TaxID=2040274 RepID=UPI0039E8111A